MLKPLTDLPAGVIGFEADGEIHADDYTDTLLPAVSAALAEGGQLRVVLVFQQWDGITGGALWEDLKMGTHHLGDWKRIALVTDVDWMAHLSKLFGWMTPGEMKQFPMAEQAAAITWAAG